MCDDYEDDFDNDLITTYHEKADGCDNDYDGCSNDGNLENNVVVDAFVLQVWLNINWVWVGGGLFPITW